MPAGIAGAMMESLEARLLYSVTYALPATPASPGGSPSQAIDLGDFSSKGRASLKSAIGGNADSFFLTFSTDDAITLKAQVSGLKTRATLNLDAVDGTSIASSSGRRQASIQEKVGAGEFYLDLVSTSAVVTPFKLSVSSKSIPPKRHMHHAAATAVNFQPPPVTVTTTYQTIAVGPSVTGSRPIKVCFYNSFGYSCTVTCAADGTVTCPAYVDPLCGDSASGVCDAQVEYADGSAGQLGCYEITPCPTGDSGEQGQSGDPGASDSTGDSGADAAGSGDGAGDDGTNTAGNGDGSVNPGTPTTTTSDSTDDTGTAASGPDGDGDTDTTGNANSADGSGSAATTDSTDDAGTDTTGSSDNTGDTGTDTTESTDNTGNTGTDTTGSTDNTGTDTTGSGYATSGDSSTTSSGYVDGSDGYGGTSSAYTDTSGSTGSAYGGDDSSTGSGYGSDSPDVARQTSATTTPTYRASKRFQGVEPTTIASATEQDITTPTYAASTLFQGMRSLTIAGSSDVAQPVATVTSPTDGSAMNFQSLQSSATAESAEKSGAATIGLVGARPYNEQSAKTTDSSVVVRPGTATTSRADLVSKPFQDEPSSWVADSAEVVRLGSIPSITANAQVFSSVRITPN